MKFRQELFWDTDPTRLDIKKHSRYIIERILDFGRGEEVRWLSQTYSTSKIKAVISSSRQLHAKSKALWSRVFK